MRLQLLSSLFTSITLIYRGKSLLASILIYSSDIIILLLLPPSLRSLPSENYILVDLKFSSRELISYRFCRPALKQAYKIKSGLALYS